jgi:hypothetical protein
MGGDHRCLVLVNGNAHCISALPWHYLIAGGLFFVMGETQELRLR